MSIRFYATQILTIIWIALLRPIDVLDRGIERLVKWGER